MKKWSEEETKKNKEGKKKLEAQQPKKTLPMINMRKNGTSWRGPS
jgi:hypothetical protein